MIAVRLICVPSRAGQMSSCNITGPETFIIGAIGYRGFKYATSSHHCSSCKITKSK